MTYGQLNTSLTWAQLTARLRETFRKWGITEFMVPNLAASNSEDGAVTVEWMFQGDWKEARCDNWKLSDASYKAPHQNLHALVLALEDARLAYARGIIGVYAQVATHFVALPAADDSDPYRMLRVQRGVDDHAIRTAYRKRLMETHPDHGGDAKEFEKVRAAARTLGVA